MRAIYTLDIDEFADDLKFNATGKGYRVTIWEHGEELGEGYAANLSAAITEALTEAAILNQ